MIKIGIIDSGIEHGFVSSNNIVFKQDFLNKDSNDCLDESGHGTCITKQIDELCHDNELYILKVLNPNNVTSFSVVDQAMEYADSLQLDIINMSFGIECERYNKEIYKRCEDFRKKNTIVVTTPSNNGAKNYLYEQENVIKVVGGRNIFDEKIIYNGDAFCTKGIPRMLPWLDNIYVLKGGNSFSTAPIIKMICDAKNNGNITFEDVKTYLFNNVNYDYNYNPFIYPDNIEKESIVNYHIYNKILKLFIKKWKIMGDVSLFSYSSIANGNFHQLLEWLGKELNVPIRIMEYQYNHFFYIENLSNKIYTDTLRYNN